MKKVPKCLFVFVVNYSANNFGGIVYGILFSGHLYTIHFLYSISMCKFPNQGVFVLIAWCVNVYK